MNNEAKIWWEGQPKERRDKMTGLLYGIRIMISDEMIEQMYQSFGK